MTITSTKQTHLNLARQGERGIAVSGWGVGRMAIEIELGETLSPFVLFNLSKRVATRA